MCPYWELHVNIRTTETETETKIMCIIQYQHKQRFAYIFNVERSKRKRICRENQFWVCAFVQYKTTNQTVYRIWNRVLVWIKLEFWWFKFQLICITFDQLKVQSTYYNFYPTHGYHIQSNLFMVLLSINFCFVMGKHPCVRVGEFSLKLGSLNSWERENIGDYLSCSVHSNIYMSTNCQCNKLENQHQKKLAIRRFKLNLTYLVLTTQRDQSYSLQNRN